MLKFKNAKSMNTKINYVKSKYFEDKNYVKVKVS